MRIRFDSHSLAKFARRVGFYAGNFAKYYMPSCIFRAWHHYRVSRLTEEDLRYARTRVDYYVKLGPGAKLDESEAVAVKDFKFPWHKKHRFSGYFFDLFRLVRVGRPEYRFNYLFGDINYETPSAAFVKSRPVAAEGYTRSALVKLDSIRHFAFIKDKILYAEKQPRLVFRNVVRLQPHRTEFLRLYHNHPLCDAGQVNDDSYVTDRAYIKGYLSVEQQLHYKFIATIEGHDVATNLKWVMSSNSIAVMPRPSIESWFMEGSLIGDFHYIEIRPDYTDLPEKLQYYIDHPDEAEAIIRHAHEYVAQFLNRRRELLIGRMVAERYLEAMNPGWETLNR